MIGFLSFFRFLKACHAYDSFLQSIDISLTDQTLQFCKIPFVQAQEVARSGIPGNEASIEVRVGNDPF